ncbi:Trk system potassium transporter TrkA [Natronococcus sp. A-GB1]|uniref:Trk system potassium transporter TrkA n=1 Tax=Natronococcus sp. A-GB1 TaxID=3037648 RepID=UPI0024204A98|nr:Trk system potassium transporter TrkA [Natronococcus sp. A-GB1]MDG5762122.1 Trk system potassium transporter TrkA [Natronococcus sp. A-GB1]
MYVLVVGAGQVGQMIASNLADSHEVAIIERDPVLAEGLIYSFDALVVTGDGTELKTLRTAGLEKADLVIACTDDDETNIVVCGAARTATDAFTIARVRRHTLLDVWAEAENAFNVSFMICTDLLVAQTIFRLSNLPRAQDIESFAGGLITMAELEIGPESPLAERQVCDLDEPDGVTFASVFRNGEMSIAQGNTCFEIGDRIVIIGASDLVKSFAIANVPDETSKANDVVIVGGSEIGYQTAREFESHGFTPRLIERDHERARELAEALPGTLVIESDATDTEFLTREHIDDADLVISALDSDEKNLLVSLLVRRFGVNRTIAVIDNTEYTNLFETVGIDVAINPREETAEEIIRFTRTDQTEKIAMLEHDRAEVIEIELGHESALTGRQIADSMTDLPSEVVIGAISRSGTLISPRGDTVPQPGDHVVLFVDATVLDEISAKV